MTGIISLGYLPDGQQVIFPEDAWFNLEGARIPASQMTHDVGQLGYWVAQRPLFQGLCTSPVTQGSGTWLAISYQTEMIDNYDMHQAGVGNDWQVFPPQTGNGVRYNQPDVYLCISYAPMNSSSTTSTYIGGIWDSGASIEREGMKITGATGHVIDVFASDLVVIQGNPFAGPPPVVIEGTCWQNTGGSVSTVNSAKCPSLTVAQCGSTRAYATRSYATPPVIGATDQLTADATGVSPAGGVKVPTNNYVFDTLAFTTNPPCARLTTAAGTQSFTNTAGVFTSVQFPNQDLDLWGMWNSGSNTKLTCVRAGLYYIYGCAAVNESSTKTGYRAAQLLQTFAAGGTAVFGGNSTQCMTGTGTTGTAMPACDLVQMAVGDTIELQFAHTNSTALTVKSGAGDCSKLIALWVSS